MGLLTAILFACSGGGGGATGTVRVSVADQPGDFQSVVITIAAVGVVSNTGGTTYQGLPAPIKIDILDINYGAGEWLQVADVLVAAGRYNQFRLVLAENGPGCIPVNPAVQECANYVTDLSGDVFPLKTPSGHSSGLKIKTPSNFDVGADQTVEVIFDIVPANAIHLNTGGEEYTIDPTAIRIVEGRTSELPVEQLSGLVRVHKDCIDDFAPFDSGITPVFTVTAAGYKTIGAATMTDGDYLAGAYVLDVAAGTYTVEAAWEGLGVAVPCGTGAQPCATIDLPAGGCSN